MLQSVKDGFGEHREGVGRIDPQVDTAHDFKRAVAADDEDRWGLRKVSQGPQRSHQGGIRPRIEQHHPADRPGLEDTHGVANGFVVVKAVEHVAKRGSKAKANVLIFANQSHGGVGAQGRLTIQWHQGLKVHRFE